MSPNAPLDNPLETHSTRTVEIRELRLELKRVRSKATAAHLEARAAELEMLLRRAIAEQDAQRKPSRSHSVNVQRTTSATVASPTIPPHRIADWDSLAAAVAKRREHRVDHPGTRGSKHDIKGLPHRRATKPKKRSPGTTPRAQVRRLPSVQATKGARCDVGKRRKKPAAWLVSTAVHGAILLSLAALTLSVHKPQDQVAFTASASATPDTEPLQTIQLESLSEPSQTKPAESIEQPAEVDPLGAIPVSTAVGFDALVSESSTAAPVAADFDSRELTTALSADPNSTTKFCGVEGGGNHFVYIVDSSLSMKDGRFESARRELLQSIDLLKPEQRFYIIFYDTHIDRMCISHPTVAEEFSVLATTQHKRAARRWAMNVELEQGESPEEALEFALSLRPDVIFLLSDGEFPQRIEDLMDSQNQVSNLFGEVRPISILHTIGYQSREGETRMRRLAGANGGQYRYIP